MTVTLKEGAKREKLKKEKPLAYAKIVKLNDKFKKGECVSMIDIAYDYTCNLKCRHCFTTRFTKKQRALTPKDLRSLSEQAHALGLCQFTISGGEPLLFPELDEVIAALDPERFHLSMSTNGYLLTREKAGHLKSIGLDKVKISLDNFDAGLHDENRNAAGAYKKAIDALFAAQGAGLDVIIQFLVTRRTAQSESTLKLAEFAEKNGFNLDITIAKALGEWEGRHDVLINEEDARFLRALHDKFPAARRDITPSFGIDRGCGTVNSNLHITKYGDVLPCGYIHISIGSIFEEKLKDILDRGLSIRHFRDHNPKCLSGEDRCFIDTYMTKFYGKPLPIHWSEAFTKDDFCR